VFDFHAYHQAAAAVFVAVQHSMSSAQNAKQKMFNSITKVEKLLNDMEKAFELHKYFIEASFFG